MHSMHLLLHIPLSLSSVTSQCEISGIAYLIADYAQIAHIMQVRLSQVLFIFLCVSDTPYSVLKFESETD